MLAVLILALILAATLGADKPTEANAPATNAEVRVVGKRRHPKPRPKPRKDLTPVEAFHRFCSPNGKVKIPEDTRPKPYKKEKPNPHERKPRK